MHSKYFLLSVSILMVAAIALAALRSPGEHGNTSIPAATTGDPPASRDLPKAPPSPDERRASRDADPRDLEQLTTTVQALHREVETLKRQNSEPSQSASTDAADATSPAEEEQRERERTMQTTAFLENSFQHETTDSAWSLQAESQVSDSLKADEMVTGSQMLQISCHATLCRIHSKHDDPVAEQTFIMSLGRLQAFGDGEAFTARTEQPDGSVQIVTYVTREGYRLPALE